MATQGQPIQRKIQSLNPATGEILAEFEPAGEREVQAAVERAQRAGREWRELPVKARARYLLAAKEVLQRRRREMAELVTREAGKPIVEALTTEVMVVLDALTYYSRRGPRLLRPQRVPHHNLAVKFKRGRLMFEPHGVIGIISPANYPLAIPCNEIIPALLAGNCVVLKPSELTPQIGLAIRDLFHEAGLPEGVLTVVLGEGDAGKALIESGIQKLIFTGSVATGKRVQALAAQRLLPTVLELGGKDPLIVCADADLDRAASGAVWGAFTNAGQACLSVERAYVVRKVAEEFIPRCVEKARRLRLGRGGEIGVDVGPLIRERQVRVVEEQVADARAHGAQVLVGGKRPGLPGFFYEPTVLTQVNHGMRIMREETFGPVLPIMVVESEEEAVARANDSEFGLSASVWTRSNARGVRLARSLACGAVMINDCISYFGVTEAPHGGVKSSGLGRTHSQLGLLEMVQVKYLDVELNTFLPKFWWFGYDAKALRLMEGFSDFLFANRLWERARGLARLLRNLNKRRV
jgi:acyl-CoA reductase-like NAD-dependent aldehyde dehydrogenase